MLGLEVGIIFIIEYLSLIWKEEKITYLDTPSVWNVGRWELCSSFEKAEPSAGCCCRPAPTRSQQTQVKPFGNNKGLCWAGCGKKGNVGNCQWTLAKPPCGKKSFPLWFHFLIKKSHWTVRFKTPEASKAQSSPGAGGKCFNRTHREWRLDHLHQLPFFCCHQSSPCPPLSKSYQGGVGAKILPTAKQWGPWRLN